MSEIPAAAGYATSTVVFAAGRFGGSGPPGPPLQPPGGGGTYDGMIEARVARLEADVGHIQRDVAEIKVAVKEAGQNLTDLRISSAALTERVRHLPTYGQNLAMLLSLLALIAALVVFQGQIQKFVGVSSVPAASGETAPKA
ncbi:MAG: hypothetical protein HZA66_01760 [Rhodopseudomonas palustris]|uniref:Uncharacterized protein n=1 Tax=Rhodopseudomonas palustris TaxID=1076 RepID=A0A933RVL4_RHOPL|nr:hypothetical protein [Rhodopseudomonas palustris]